MANNFKIIYKILKILSEAMDIEEFDISAIGYEELGVSEPMWCFTMEMLVDNDYITGVRIIADSGIGFSRLPGVKMINPRITLLGLEYLEENSIMRKVANLAKGIKDSTPFM